MRWVRLRDAVMSVRLGCLNLISGYLFFFLFFFTQEFRLCLVFDDDDNYDWTIIINITAYHICIRIPDNNDYYNIIIIKVHKSNNNNNNIHGNIFFPKLYIVLVKLIIRKLVLKLGYIWGTLLLRLHNAVIILLWYAHPKSRSSFFLSLYSVGVNIPLKHTKRIIDKIQNIF